MDDQQINEKALERIIDFIYDLMLEDKNQENPQSESAPEEGAPPAEDPPMDEEVLDAEESELPASGGGAGAGKRPPLKRYSFGGKIVPDEKPASSKTPVPQRRRY